MIRYTTANGQTFTHHSNVCSWPAVYEQGQQITLYVDRNDPERLQLDNWFPNGLQLACSA
ncbi:MAG: DUF3592 domain-containing protein [Anaerolineales bacterium]